MGPAWELGRFYVFVLFAWDIAQQLQAMGNISVLFPNCVHPSSILCQDPIYKKNMGGQALSNVDSHTMLTY